MVKLLQHTSEHYAPRTYVNATMADLTVALMIDADTAGELCTRKAAKEKYLGLLYLHNKYIENVSAIVKVCKQFKVKTLNIAGNGIYTFKRHKISQSGLNFGVYTIISGVHRQYELKKIISGGQTGVDFAAGVACKILGIECEMLLPKGYKQRDENGVDFTQENVKLRQKLITQAKQLTKLI